MKSNISDLAQSIVNRLYNKWKSFLPKLPVYSNVIVEEIKDKTKIITIYKDNIKIIVGKDIEIIEEEKKIIVDKDFNIIVKGNINLVANSNNKANNNVNETFVTEQRLKTYLSTITDSFGSPIFIIGNISNADLGTNYIKTTIES
jgi:hypothetical protein